MPRAPRRAFWALLACAVAVTQLAAGTGAGADTASELEQARQRVTEAQAAANATAVELADAQLRFEQLAERIEQLDAQIGAAQTRIAELEVLVVERAVTAYVRGAGRDGLDSLLSTGRPMQAARRSQFLEQANRKDNRNAADLSALREDLAADQARVEKQRDEQRVVRDDLAAKNTEVQANLAAASQARDDLAARLERERAAAAAAEAARIRAAQAASRPQTGGNSAVTSAAVGQIIVNPGGGPFQCPVAGSAYGDSYGPRGGGFHNGIDMFAPGGVPLVAVKAGRLTFMPMNGAGGNEAYLAADDGNVYFYAHLSQYVGGPRSVAQGEVIGLVGATGNASGTHLHFEIRLGGANGQRINPYPTLQSAGC